MGRGTGSPAVGAAWIVGAVATAAWVGLLADAERSEARFRRVLDADATRAERAWEVLADHRARRGRTREAIEAIDAAWRVAPNARYALKAARWCEAAGDDAGAIERLERALRAYPRHAALREHLARSLERVGAWRALGALCAEGERLHPADARWPVGAARAALETGDTTAAVASLRRAVLLEPPPSLRATIESLRRRIRSPSSAPRTRR